MTKLIQINTNNIYVDYKIEMTKRIQINTNNIYVDYKI